MNKEKYVTNHYLLIPHKIIIDKNIDNIAYYVYLCIKYDKEVKKTEGKTQLNYLKDVTTISSNKVLKRCLTLLSTYEYIFINMKEGDRLPYLLDITLPKMCKENVELFGKWETIDMRIINMIEAGLQHEKSINIPNLKQHALRLLSLYWLKYLPDQEYSVIPISSRDKNCDTVNSLIPITKSYIRPVNSFLNKYGIVEIEGGERFEKNGKLSRSFNRYKPKFIAERKNSKKSKNYEENAL